MEQSNALKGLIVRLNIVVIVLLVATLVSVLLFWKPWDAALTANTRKITITGSASVKAEPDQFQFNPSYTRDTTAEISKLNDQVVAKLKSLGVTDSQIKNNAARYGSAEIYYMAPVSGKEQTTLSLTITVDDKELAQKVQTYLVTTDPSGSITPYPTFSTAKQKELQDKVRNDAITDARKKADDTAKGLGAKVGKVIEVNEGFSGGGSCGSGIACPARDAATSSDGAVAPEKNLSLQPGSDEFTYSVTVVFALD